MKFAFVFIISVLIPFIFSGEVVPDSIQVPTTCASTGTEFKMSFYGSFPFPEKDITNIQNLVQLVGVDYPHIVSATCTLTKAPVTLSCTCVPNLELDYKIKLYELVVDDIHFNQYEPDLIVSFFEGEKNKVSSYNKTYTIDWTKSYEGKIMFMFEKELTSENMPEIYLNDKLLSCSKEGQISHCKISYKDFPGSVKNIVHVKNGISMVGESGVTYKGKVVNKCGQEEVKFEVSCSKGEFYNKYINKIIILIASLIVLF